MRALLYVFVAIVGVYHMCKLVIHGMWRWLWQDRAGQWFSIFANDLPWPLYWISLSETISSLTIRLRKKFKNKPNITKSSLAVERPLFAYAYKLLEVVNIDSLLPISLSLASQQLNLLLLPHWTAFISEHVTTLPYTIRDVDFREKKNILSSFTIEPGRKR